MYDYTRLGKPVSRSDSTSNNIDSSHPLYGIRNKFDNDTLYNDYIASYNNLDDKGKKKVESNWAQGNITMIRPGAPSSPSLNRPKISLY